MADSYNELFGLGSHSVDADLAGWWPLQDDAASTTVADHSGNGITATLQGGDNTSDKSTTGPNNWLAKAFSLNGTDDFISVPGTSLASFGNTFTFGVRVWVSSSASSPVIWGQSNTNDAWMFELRTSNNSIGIPEPGTNVAISNGSAFTDEVWSLLGYTRSGTGSSTHAFYSGGASVAVSTNGSANFTDTTATKQIGQRGDGTQYLLGRICDVAVFNRVLTAAEHSQWNAGPEPVNSVAPVVSGSTQVGQTLTATSGTWGLDSPFSGGTNGTVTYAYQWTRSDDSGGTNEADIGGATSTTYQPTSSDLGKFLRCRVRASNTGGYDAAADTASNFTGPVYSGAGAALLLQMMG